MEGNEMTSITMTILLNLPKKQHALKVYWRVQYEAETQHTREDVHPNI
jgi:hypothetical protein